MQLPPVKKASQEPDLHFPYNMRFGVYFWKLLFLKDELPAASQGQSAQWARGRYLADVLGHCAECHTPRGKLGQLDLGMQWKGAQIGRWLAPDITPQGLAERGWTERDIAAFMKTGIAPQGSAWGEMHTVVALSTSKLADEDSAALVRFMTGDTPVAPRPPVEDASADQKFAAGRQTYLNLCAGCHATGGQGQPHVVVPMAGNSSLRLADPRNLVVSVLDGIPAQVFPGLERMQEMPGFGHELGDAQVAELTNYLRGALRRAAGRCVCASRRSLAPAGLRRTPQANRASRSISGSAGISRRSVFSTCVRCSTISAQAVSASRASSASTMAVCSWCGQAGVPGAS